MVYRQDCKLIEFVIYFRTMPPPPPPAPKPSTAAAASKTGATAATTKLSEGNAWANANVILLRKLRNELQ